MRTEIQKILSIQKFFKIISNSGNEIQYALKSPSQLLIQNIYLRWLESIWAKAEKNFPVLLLKPNRTHKNQQPYGIIKNDAPKFDCDKIISQNLNKYAPNNITNLEFSLIVGKQDVMQYFVQWQRYRKYWWSSITTTPSLFSVNDIKYHEKSADVDIVVKLPWGEQPVENVSIISEEDKDGSATLSCITSMETALLTILSDATLNSTKEGYLRLHRKIAPYKFSFALKYDDENNKNTLTELATLVNCRLAKRNLKTWFPEFSLPITEQIKENIAMGVVYTAVLSEPTLKDGIFHLLNSSTMLQEQVHLADFDSYASLLCGN